MRGQLFSILTASLFLLGTLAAAAPATQDQIDAAEASLDNQGPKGDDVLQGGWAEKNEIHRWYLRDGDAVNYAREGRTGNCCGSYYTLYDPVPDAVLGNAGAGSWSTPLTMDISTTSNDFQLHRIQATLNIASGGNPDVRLQLMDGATAIPGATLIFPFDALVPNVDHLDAPGIQPLAGTTEYSAFAEFSPPVTIPGGADLDVRFDVVDTSVTDTNPVQLQYGDGAADSFFELHGTTSRINAWTENRDGEATIAFPTAQDAPSEDRTIVVRAAHVSALGDWDGAGQEPLLRHGTQMTIIDKNGNDRTGINDVRVNTRIVRVDSGAESGLNFVEYVIQYPTNFKEMDANGVLTNIPYDGPLFLEISPPAQNWKETLQVAIGGTGVSIRLADFEDAVKTILVGEETTFLLTVTNEGLVEDDVVISAAEINGWGVEAIVDTLDLGPDESRTFPVTITHPAGAVSTDFQDFTIEAISAKTGRSDSVDLRVILTGIETNGVDLIASKLDVIKMSPGQTQTAGLVLKNLGNSQEGFTLTTSGAPLGWTASVVPSSMELGAKSQGGTLLRMTAPPDAKQGDAFALTVTARAIADSTIRDAVTIPFEIFFREDFSFEVVSGAVDGVFTTAQPTLADMQAYPDSGIAATQAAPGVHALRDEGPDATVFGQGTAPCKVPVPVAGPVTVNNCPISDSSSAWDGDNGADRDYDQSTLFRLQLTNHASRPDEIRVTPSWVFDGAWESLDSVECEDGSDNGSTRDQIPDGWRFRYWEANTPEPAALPGRSENHHDNSPNRLYNPGEGGNDWTRLVKLAPGETKFLWVELGWTEVARIAVGNNGTDCQGTDQSGGDGRESPPTMNAVVRFRGESLQDLTAVEELHIRAHLARNTAQTRDGTDAYSDRHNDVLLGVDEANYSNAEGSDLSETLRADGATTAERTAIYNMRAINAGNEMDIIRVEIPLETDQFEYFIRNVDTKSMSANRLEITPGTPKSVDCEFATSGNFMDCTMGVFDEVAFEVHVRAKAGQVPIGLVHNTLVRAISLDSTGTPGVAAVSNAVLSTLATGSFAFAFSEPVVADGIHDVDVPVGGSVLVPFTLANQGTTDDSYQVDLLEKPADSTGWQGILGFQSPQFLAAGKSHHGFITIEAPATAAPGDSETFRVRGASLGEPGSPQRTLRIQANVVAASNAISVAADPPEVLAFPGQPAELTFKATRTSGAATDVTFEVDTTALPAGWSLTGAASKTANYAVVDGTATTSFTVNVPATAVGSSRVVVPVTGTDSNGNKATGHGIVTLNSQAFGVRLSSPEDFDADTIEGQVVSGSKVTIPMRVQNLGGGVDGIKLTTEPLPAGWVVTFAEGSPDAAQFQPFEARNVLVTVHAPAGLAPGQGHDIVVIGTSTSDTARTDTLVLAVKTGASVLGVGVAATPIKYAAPFEEVSWRWTVQNNGNVRDELDMTAGLSAAYKDLINVKFTPAKIILAPGESASGTAVATVPEGFLSGAVVPIQLQATSAGDLQDSFGFKAVEMRVLDHRSLDIDNDGNPEYAVDRDRDASNGMEDFTDPVATGKKSASLNMRGLLSDAAVSGYTETIQDANGTFQVFTWVFDLTGDLRIDHFIDENADGIADWFWDPMTGARDQLTLRKDVTSDGILEYFVDVNGDGLLDVWYDITTGVAGVLIKVDVDGDGQVDFIVDLDNDGQHDDAEPVLYGKNGQITKITQVIDINGDGRGDLVVDEDGDGIPDHFIPAGKTRGVKIVLEDVNGDGVEDWTYDSNNDGKRDTYYDPVTGQTGRIDTGSEFIDGVLEYWYVSALFALVAVLFVVLVVVTRR